jgi:hypothetical protein
VRRRGPARSTAARRTLACAAQRRLQWSRAAASRAPTLGLAPSLPRRIRVNVVSGTRAARPSARRLMPIVLRSRRMRRAAPVSGVGMVHDYPAAGRPRQAAREVLGRAGRNAVKQTLRQRHALACRRVFQLSGILGMPTFAEKRRYLSGFPSRSPSTGPIPTVRPNLRDGGGQIEKAGLAGRPTGDFETDGKTGRAGVVRRWRWRRSDYPRGRADVQRCARVTY